MDWFRGTSKLTIRGRNVQQGALLAEGGFAYVYRGSDVQTGEPLAIRLVLLQDAEAINKAREEISILDKLPLHPHIIRFLGAEICSAVGGRGAESKCRAISLFEMCDGGSLLARLEEVLAGARSQTGLYLQEPEVLEVFVATAGALTHLHALGVVHYDVKSENILRSMDGKWKLGDFGSASERTFNLAGAPRKAILEVEEFFHGRCTPIYRPPEIADIYLRWNIGPKADVFALGCVLYATLTGQHPFPMDSALANIQAKYRVPSEVEAAYSKTVLLWLRGSLEREPELRFSAATLEQEASLFLASGTIPARARDVAATVTDRVGAFAGDSGPGSPCIPVGLASDWVADFSGIGAAIMADQGGACPASSADTADSAANWATTEGWPSNASADSNNVALVADHDPRICFPSKALETGPAQNADTRATESSTEQVEHVEPGSAESATAAVKSTLSAKVPEPGQGQIPNTSSASASTARGELVESRNAESPSTTAKSALPLQVTSKTNTSPRETPIVPKALAPPFTAVAQLNPKEPSADSEQPERIKTLGPVNEVATALQGRRQGKRRRAFACLCGKVKTRD